MRKIAALLSAALLVIGVSTPAQAANAYDKKWTTFKTLTFSGIGDDVVEFPKTLKAGLVEASHDGSSNFIVYSLDAGLEQSYLIVNEIGSYNSTRAFGLGWLGEKAKGFEIKADGNWTLTVKPLSKAPTLPSAGTGSGLYKVSVTKRASWTFTHDGSSNFIVYQYCTSGLDDLLVNEIGSYSGRNIVAKGTCLIDIAADGAWKIKKK